jgi:hypothetical protein
MDLEDAKAEFTFPLRSAREYLLHHLLPSLGRTYALVPGRIGGQINEQAEISLEHQRQNFVRRIGRDSPQIVSRTFAQAHAFFSFESSGQDEHTGAFQLAGTVAAAERRLLRNTFSMT